MAEKSIFQVGDHFPRPYDANFRGITNNPFRWQRPLGKFIFVLFCCCIRRDEEKETHNINVVGKTEQGEPEPIFGSGGFEPELYWNWNRPK